MIYRVKYRLVQLRNRYESKVWNNMEGLVDSCIINDCCKFLPEEFESIAEADEFRNLKSYPDDYIVVNIW